MSKISLKEMKEFSKNMPKTINEAMDFNGPAMPMESDDEEMMEPEVKQEESGMDVAAFVDDIRKKSLKGMAALADNPEDEKYVLLKKIWQICDKKPEQQQNVFNNGMQQ